MKELILNNSDKIKETIIAHRRHIHKNPELSFQEHETAKYIEQTLQGIGITTRRANGTGVIADIGSGDKCVALRADIDALPILEETGLDCASQNKGIMHACGHDMHVAMLLGAAEIIKNQEKHLSGTVRLIFQPAEEKLPGGAPGLIEEGALNDPTPAAIFGQHIDPSLPTGLIATVPGPIMASTDEFYWTINSKSVHAATPHLGSDGILTASTIVTQAHSMLNKIKDPLDPAVISITSIQGGNAPNILPETVKMMGTMRTYNEKLRNIIKQRMLKLTNNIGESFNTNAVLRIEAGYPALINDEKTADFIKKSAQELFGEDGFQKFTPKMWAEDFAYYAQKIPATFYFIGVNPGIDMPPLHNPKLSPDESALSKGAAFMAYSAIQYIASL